ncbi:site-specific integrase [Pseudomonadota bacterium]
MFLDFLGKCDIKNFNQIRPEDLSDFVCSLSRFSQKTVTSVVSYMRVYQRYLFY